jgi:hypothetical protein
VASVVGGRLLGFLRELQVTTTWAVVVTEEAGAWSRWQLGGSTWEATVFVEPRRWLGLEFEARDPVTGKRATYDIDTDLYDLALDSRREFADEIERDILEFIGNLREGAVLRGNAGSKFVAVPTSRWNDVPLVKRGYPGASGCGPGRSAASCARPPRSGSRNCAPAG